MDRKEHVTTNETKVYVGFVGVMVVATIVGLWVGMKVVRPRVTAPIQVENLKTEQVPMTVGTAMLLVEVRDDDKERELGLSWRESLGKNEGMLFVFDAPQRPVFWMKDMKFDLDVVWIREGKVVGVEEKVSAPTLDEPIAQTMIPTVEVDQVLEVPAGLVQENQIKLGDEVSMTSKN